MLAVTSGLMTVTKLLKLADKHRINETTNYCSGCTMALV